MGQTIHELPVDERPREKLASRGADALSDCELLAILLRTGVQGANAIEVARQLLERYGSLSGLARCSVAEMAQIKGVGLAKAVQLVAAFGLGARLARETYSRLPLKEARQVYELLGPEMRALRTEACRVLLLDARYRLIRIEEISVGSLDESIAHPREVFRSAIVHSAYAIIFVHNHPSGDPTPSASDHRLTNRLREAAKLLTIELYDHIIIGAPGPDGQPGYTSYRELHLL